MAANRTLRNNPEISEDVIHKVIMDNGKWMVFAEYLESSNIIINYYNITIRIRIVFLIPRFVSTVQTFGEKNIKGT